jgi:predicted RNase H-like nuclease (RuvC/YqgF family)
VAQFVITISGKGIREATVRKLVEQLQDKYGDGANVTVHKNEPPESRADRYADATGKIEEGRAEMESLRDELQEWRDNLPENLSGGSKAEELDGAITALEEAIDKANEAAESEVSFPAMM